MAVDEAGECSSRGLYEGEFFPGVSRIAYEGPDSLNPLAFHYYNADEVIMGKPMKEWWENTPVPVATLMFLHNIFSNL